MCGMHADGSKADGFKSMVVAQYTGIGLQKDDNAFVKYNTTTGVWDDKTVAGNEAISTDSRAVYKPDYENFHIKVSNKSRHPGSFYLCHWIRRAVLGRKWCRYCNHKL